ncbi:MAG TPA: DUF488 domain-containing protein [Nordella sp.]|nr:DUF488 domain-containing protein [Nordella sp.]
MPVIQVKRIYEPPARDDGLRILVDRIWPRGISKEKAALDLWAKEIAPSTSLRKWFHHDPGRWSEFQTRYLAELKGHEAELDELRRRIAGHRTTLLFAAANIAQNHAHVLKDVLERPPPRG